MITRQYSRNELKEVAELCIYSWNWPIIKNYIRWNATFSQWLVENELMDDIVITQNEMTIDMYEETYTDYDASAQDRIFTISFSTARVACIFQMWWLS